MFNPFCSSSGSEIFAGNLAKSFETLGCEVHIVCSDRDRSTSQLTKKIALTKFNGINYPILGILNDYYKRVTISKRILRNSKFDAVLAIGAGQGLVFTELAGTNLHPSLVYFTFDCMKGEGEAVMRVLSKKQASLYRRSRTVLRYFQLTLLDKVSCKFSDLVLAGSAYTKRSLNDYYGIGLGKIKVAYTGIPSDYAKDFDSVDPSEPTFLHVATNHERKGTIYLLEALSLLKKKHGLNVKVCIVGQKDPTYINMAERLEVNTSFIDTQLYRHKEIYSACTALIVPSVSEGFCLPVIEAAMFGKPAIVSDAGSLPELIEDGIDGYVVPVADVDSLAEKMYILATDKETVRRMSLKAKEKAQRFEIDKIAKATLSFMQMQRNN